MGSVTVLLTSHSGAKMRLRSITLKLTLAFLFVGLMGAALIAFFVGARTEREFDRFVLDQHQADFIAALSDHYRLNGSWQGIGDLLEQNRYSRRWKKPPLFGTLVDAEGTILLAGQPHLIGQRLSPGDLERAIPLEVDDNIVGYFTFAPFFNPREPGSAEAAFLRSVNRAIILSALGGAVAALALGAFLARTLTRPIRELTAATQMVARGELGYQVNVKAKDELGDLAASFNQMSADLEQANKLRRQMTADIAHDLRTPLSIILGYTEALSDGKFQGTPEIYEVMHKEAQHLSHLVEDLRTLSLADAGELKLVRRPVAPQALLESTASAHRAQALQSQIDLAVEAAPGLPLVEVDPDRMAQVLGNLVSNALRYTPAQGQITLSAQANEHTVCLRVQDTGAGIAPADAPHIFDRFYRADKPRQRQEGESGLGLAIAKSIVEAHGGAISVESAPGAGAAFTITLKTV